VISCMQSFVWTCTHHLHCPRQSGREHLCISATQACNQQSMHVAALSQMCRHFEAKRLHATPLEAVSTTLQQAVVNKVSADTAYLQLLLQGTLRRGCYLSVIRFCLLHHSSHLFLAVRSSCITRLALLLILLLNRPLKKLKMFSCCAKWPRLQPSRKTCSDSWSCKLTTTKKQQAAAESTLIHDGNCSSMTAILKLHSRYRSG